MTVDDVELDIRVDATEMAPEQLSEVLEALQDVYNLGVVDVGLRSPNLFACLDCGRVVSTNSVLRHAHEYDGEPFAPRYTEGDEPLPESAVQLRDACRSEGCEANAYVPLSFEITTGAEVQ